MQDNDRHNALLDGIAGSFVMSDYSGKNTPEPVSGSTGADWSWSCLMRHYVSVSGSDVNVIHSDRGTSDRFSKKSVETKLDDFLTYLEATPQPEWPDAIDHVVRCFQNLRAEIPATAEGQLASFLALAALRLEHVDVPAQELPDFLGEIATVARKYDIETELISGRALDRDFTRRFYEDLLGEGSGAHRLHLNLTIRHASGELFQAAHLAPAPPSLQLPFFGLPTAAVRVRPHSLKGIAYTPVGLARSLAEQAIAGLTAGPASPLVILDPACGSGTFLIEAVAALARGGWTGSLKLVGYDVSATAIAAAKFALACVVRDHASLNIEVDLKVADFLDPEFTPVTAHITIMNPPYMSWSDMNVGQRAQLRAVLGDNYRGRPDQSMAFVSRAVAIAPKGGVIATLVPVGVLAGEYAMKWRNELARIAPPTLIGSLGDHTLFRFATVNVAILVLSKGAIADGATMLWASELPGAASASLRAIRRRRESRIADPPPALESPWALYRLTSNELFNRPTWLPSPGLLGPTLARFTAISPATVSDLFSVKLGVRTGDREVFVIGTEQYKDLSERERGGFKPIAEKEGIDGGGIAATRYLFVAGEDIDREEELIERFPSYTKQFLLPSKSMLAQRQRIDPNRWWRLAEARNTWRNSKDPRIVSRRWVRNNGYAVDIDGAYAVVQAYAWFPLSPLRQDVTQNRRFGTLVDVLRIYCIMFSSDVFFRIVREFSTNASGGQVDLQQKYLNLVPIPLLPSWLAADRELSSMVDKFDPSSFPTLAERNAFAARCYGLDVSVL
jgi:SAM-dependent methyltransferase